jgi:hypothetical protein
MITVPWGATVPGRIGSIVSIHNPSIEVHVVDGDF